MIQFLTLSTALAYPVEGIGIQQKTRDFLDGNDPLYFNCTFCVHLAGRDIMNRCYEEPLIMETEIVAKPADCSRIELPLVGVASENGKNRTLSRL